MGSVMTSRHRLPAFVHARNLPVTLKFCSDIAANSASAVICDAADLKFVDPAGLCLLAATCHRLANSGKVLRLENVPAAIMGYLSRMDLFKACGIEYDEKFARHDRKLDLVEICSVDKASSIDPLADKITNALIGRTPDFDPNAQPDEMTGYTPQDYLYDPLRYIFSELLENALTHAKRAGYLNTQAWVAAQYYPSNDRIRLAVVDNGCGFLASLTRHQDLAERTHSAAIRLALRPRVTCNPDLEVFPDETANQGLGLTVVKEIAAQNQGVMRLVSGNSLVELHSVGREHARGVPSWQGVLLALEFERNLLRRVNLRSIIQALRSAPSPSGLRFE